MTQQIRTRVKYISVFVFFFLSTQDYKQTRPFAPESNNWAATSPSFYFELFGLLVTEKERTFQN